MVLCFGSLRKRNATQRSTAERYLYHTVYNRADAKAAFVMCAPKNQKWLIEMTRLEAKAEEEDDEDEEGEDEDWEDDEDEDDEDDTSEES